jgi:hypothetical protein
MKHNNNVFFILICSGKLVHIALMEGRAQQVSMRIKNSGKARQKMPRQGDSTAL